MSDLLKNQTPNPRLRKPPTAGGPTRVDQRGASAGTGRKETITRHPQKKPSRLKKALPYLIPAFATGGSIVLFSGVSNYLIS